MNPYLLILAAAVLLMGGAIVLFEKDGKQAKEEGRKRNPFITAFFVIAVGGIGMIVIGYILLLLLTLAIVASM